MVRSIQQLSRHEVEELICSKYSLIEKFFKRKAGLRDADREDLTQETMSLMCKGIHGLREVNKMDAWAHRIAVNKYNQFVKDEIRQKKLGEIVALNDREEVPLSDWEAGDVCA